MFMKRINIAIDGFSSCGKSTVAKQLAQRLNYTFIDSGAMYRAITLYLMRLHLVDSSEKEINQKLGDIHLSFQLNPSTSKIEITLNDEFIESEIRSMEVSNNVSKIAKLASVRMLAVKQQQSMGKSKGVVMDGRDIGTVVFPDAELKIFMTASIAVRVERRYQELMAKGEMVNKDEVKANLESRDYIDSHREISPLRQAADAKVLDNSELTMDEQLDIVLDWVEEAILNL